MDELLRARLLRHLACLQQVSREQVITYIETLHARAYAPDTLYAVAGAVKKFVLLLPESRRAFVSHDLARSESRDLDTFIAAARAAAWASTINNKLSLLREFFPSLLRRAMTRSRCCAAAITSAAPRRPAQAEPEETSSVLQRLDSTRPAALSADCCGLRVSEACALAWDDVDLPALALRVDGGKGDVDRMAYLAPDVERALRLWQAHRSGSSYLFPSRKAHGAHLGRRNVFQMMRKYLREAGIAGAIRSTACAIPRTQLSRRITLEVLKELRGLAGTDDARYAELYETTKRRQLG